MFTKDISMLEDDVIQLRALEKSDVDALFLWENNPEHWKVSHTISPYSRQALSLYIESAGDIYSDKQLRLIICRKEDQKALGCLDLFDCDFKNKRAGIGILIADKIDRGKGVASRCLSLTLNYCREVLGLHQVYCNILADNAESLQLFKKFGFEKIGLKKEWTHFRGAFYDEWLLQKIL